MFIKRLLVYLLISVSGLICLSPGATSYWCQSEKEEIKEEDGGIPLQDRMDLAVEQENELTMDPALGYVPKERLLQAYQYAEELRGEHHAERMMAPIASMNWTERGPANVGGRTRTIMVDPNDATHKTVFAGGVGGGLWKTTDITASTPVWTAINDFFANIAISCMTYDSTTPTTMYFGTGEGYFNGDAIRGLGIWKSTNAGATWSHRIITCSESAFIH